MSNSWVRLWLDMPTDPKFRTISKQSKQPLSAVISMFVCLMTDAANASERGRTQINDDDLASTLDLETEQVTAIRNAMQGRVLDGDFLMGWERRQPLREDGSAERSRAWREKQKERTQANASERKKPKPNAPDTDTDTDTDITPPTPPRGNGADERFENFWDAYPRKAGKRDAAKAWAKLKPDEALCGTIMAALERHKRCDMWTKDGGQFVPYPATYLRGERWTDSHTLMAQRSALDDWMVGAV